MLNKRIIPCLLLKGSGLYKTLKFKEPKYVGDPINAVKIFNEKEVDELIFLDITATIENKKPNFKLLHDIATECFMPFAYGGGIHNIEDAEKIFSLGAEKIVLNTAAIENPWLIEQLATNFGNQSIVVSIDVKKDLFGKYEVYIRGGKKNTKLKPDEFSKRMENTGAGELIINSIDRDGTMQGYDIELIKRVSSSVSIPVIASGGAGKIQDFTDAIKNGGASAVAAGAMFVFIGVHRAVLINYPENFHLT